MLYLACYATYLQHIWKSFCWAAYSAGIDVISGSKAHGNNNDPANQLNADDYMPGSRDESTFTADSPTDIMNAALLHPCSKTPCSPWQHIYCSLQQLHTGYIPSPGVQQKQFVFSSSQHAPAGVNSGVSATASHAHSTASQLFAAMGPDMATLMQSSAASTPDYSILAAQLDVVDAQLCSAAIDPFTGPTAAKSVSPVTKPTPQAAATAALRRAQQAHPVSNTERNILHAQLMQAHSLTEAAHESPRLKVHT